MSQRKSDHKLILTSFAIAYCLAGTSVFAQDAPIGRHYAAPIVLLTFNPEDRLLPNSPAVVDLNNDGRDDLVASGLHPPDWDAPESTMILVSTEAGTMEDATHELISGPVPEIPRGPRQYLSADFNGDGYADLFLVNHGAEPDCGDDTVTCWTGAQNQLLLSDGQGQLSDATATNLPTYNDYSHGSSVLDYDKDGDMDIWVNNLAGSPLQNPQFSYLLENDGSGKFTVAADSSFHWDTPIVGRNGILPDDPVDLRGFWSQAVDANGDGWTDLDLGEVWAQHGDEFIYEVRLLLNQGGTFAALPGDAWSVPSWLEHAVADLALVTDINGDGLDDELLHQDSPPGNPSLSSPGLQVLISNGDGTFRDETALRFPHDPAVIIGNFQLHDVDLDGHLDLVVSTDYGARIAINDGEGVFRQLADDWVSLGGFWIVLDVDGDGGTDFFTTNDTSYLLHKMNLPYGAELDGTTGDDRLIGGAWDNVYRGLEGDDVLDGGLGNDRLDGGPGNDTLIGGKGNDRYVYHAADLAYDDTIDDQAGGADRLQFEGFDLSAVSQANQGPNGELILSFAAGGSITVAHHFQGGTSGVERLLVGGEVYDISEDPAFAGGSIESLLGTAQDAFAMNAGLNGNWWNGPARDGEGVQIEVADGGNGTIVFVATIYTYDLQGHQIFLVTVGTANGATAEVKVFITEGGVWGQDFDPHRHLHGQRLRLHPHGTAAQCRLPGPGLHRPGLRPGAGHHATGALPHAKSELRGGGISVLDARLLFSHLPQVPARDARHFRFLFQQHPVVMGPRNHALLDGLADAPVLLAEQVHEGDGVADIGIGLGEHFGFEQPLRDDAGPRGARRPQGTGADVVREQVQEQVGQHQLGVVALAGPPAQRGE